MPIGLLGTVELVDDTGTVVEIGGLQPRVVLALLVAADGRTVASDTLVDAIWQDRPPSSASGTLQTYVSRLRRSLGSIGASIVHEPAGYRLEVDRDQVDLYRFESLADASRSALDRGDASTARTLLIGATELWRGPALLEVRDRPQLAGVARRLDERRLAVLEDRFTADLALGRHAAVVGELTQAVADHPLREGLWALLALARYRSGHQADALRAISTARATLRDDLGVDPGPRLRELEAAILAQDSSLDFDRSVLTHDHEVGDATPVGTTNHQRSPHVAPAPRMPMVGRSDELAQLERVLDDVFAGESRVAIVQGEAGVGKTRLVDELGRLASMRAATVVTGRSLEGGAAPAYWPWLSVLRPLRDADLASTDPFVEQLLDPTGTLPTAVAADRSQLLEGVLRLLGTSAASPALVVILEDVQWADVGSLELLTQVIGSLGLAGALIVLTLREGESSDREAVVSVLAAASRRSGTVRLRLTGLDLSETGKLLDQLQGTAVDPSVARAVHARAGGNPFFTIELTHLLGDRAADGSESPTMAAGSIPESVRDVVRQRLVQLPESTVDLLRLAAIAGREIDVDLLARASGRSLDDCLDDVDIAVANRVLVPSGHGGLWFSHALVREVVADDMTALRRARAHLRIADAIDAEGRGADQAEIYAEHLFAAAPIGVGRRAADALDAAAKVAIRRFAVSTAAGLLTRSLELRRMAGSDPDAEAAELTTLADLVRAQRALFGYPGGMDHYARGADLARRLGMQDLELEMVWSEWAAYDTSCDVARARPLRERISALGDESDDPILRLAGATSRGIQHWHDGDIRGAFEAFERAVAVGPELPEVLDQFSLVGELYTLCTSFRVYMAEQVGVLEDPEAAFAAAARVGNLDSAVTWCFSCTSAAMAGDPGRVERGARRVLEAEAGETLGFWGGQARMYLGAILIGTGRAEEGRQFLETGLSVYHASGVRTGLPSILAVAAHAEVAAGDLQRAETHLAEAREVLALWENYAVPYVMLAEADVAEARGVEVTAQRIEAERIATSQGAAKTAERARAAQTGQSWLGLESRFWPPSSDSASSPSSA